jgi:hypothetical protein
LQASTRVALRGAIPTNDLSIYHHCTFLVHLATECNHMDLTLASARSKLSLPSADRDGSNGGAGGA